MKGAGIQVSDGGKAFIVFWKPPVHCAYFLSQSQLRKTWEHIRSVVCVSALSLSSPLFILDAMTQQGVELRSSNSLVLLKNGGSQTLVGFALQGVQECWQILAGAYISPGSSLMGEKVGLKNSLQTRGHKTRSVGADEQQSWARSSAKLQESKDSGTGWRLRLRSCACQEVSRMNNPFNL